MARYCICGCGKQLVKPNGDTDYDRMFFNKECRNRDKAQRIADERARFKKLSHCPHCGQDIRKNKAAAQNA